jgi:protein-disulfide isomerase
VTPISSAYYCGPGGVRSGVNGTPSFFINGHRHDGPFEFDDLVEAIESRIA